MPNPSPRPHSSVRSRAPQIASHARSRRRRRGAARSLAARYNLTPIPSRSRDPCCRRSSGEARRTARATLPLVMWVTASRRRSRPWQRPPLQDPPPPFMACSSSGAGTRRVAGERGGMGRYMMARYLPNRAARLRRPGSAPETCGPLPPVATFQLRRLARCSPSILVKDSPARHKAVIRKHILGSRRKRADFQ